MQKGEAVFSNPQHRPEPCGGRDGRTWALKSSCLLLLGGAWVVISRVISMVAILITLLRVLLILLTTTHESPSSP